mmetsp:Transcript_61234/g.68563  ORF Transcript_61234/g.68563 Transcript_61234/m.68563 type:complete len:103 (+) Transcript_61234:434-742(+)
MTSIRYTVLVPYRMSFFVFEINGNFFSRIFCMQTHRTIAMHDHSNQSILHGTRSQIAHIDINLGTMESDSILIDLCGLCRFRHDTAIRLLDAYDIHVAIGCC